MRQSRHRRHVTHLRATRRVFWAAVWLAIVLVAIKAYYLGIPATLALTDFGNYFRSLAAISYVDVLFAAICWAAARAILALAVDRRRTSSAVSIVFVAIRGVRRGLRGGERHLLRHLRRISHLPAARARRQPADVELVGRRARHAACHPGARRAAARLRRSRRSTVRLVRPQGPVSRSPRIAFVPLGVWLILGIYGFSAAWTTRQDRRIAENPHWVLISSWWQVVSGDGTVRLTDQFPAADLTDFDPIGPRPPSPGIHCPAGLPRPRPKGRRAASAERHRHRPRIGRGAVGRPERRAVRLHAGPQGRIRARARRRQFLRAHRPQLEFAGRDAAVGLPEARFPRRHRRVSAAARDLARVGVPRSRLSHGVRHAKRSELGGMGTVSRADAASASCAISTSLPCPI